MFYAGRTAYKALSEWHVSEGVKGTYVEIPGETPLCNPSCCSSMCTKCREHQIAKPKTPNVKRGVAASKGEETEREEDGDDDENMNNVGGDGDRDNDGDKDGYGSNNDICN